MLKTLLADLDGELVCAVVPVAGSLDLKALAARARRPARGDGRAGAGRAVERVRGRRHQPAGAGHALRTVVDETAELFDTVLVSAGRRGLSVELAPADLVRLTGAVVADVAR